MNVYDFDKTIYNGDSTLDFYFFCIRRNPGIIKYIPKQIIAGIKYKLGMISKTRFKEIFYCFFRGVKDIDSTVNDFWNIYEHKIKQWYKTEHSDTDLIISASPEFLLKEISVRLGITNLIASKVDEKTGLYVGKNCYGEEKVNRFRQEFEGTLVEKFYSDSKSDQPMRNISLEGFLVKGDRLYRWD